MPFKESLGRLKKAIPVATSSIPILAIDDDSGVLTLYTIMLNRAGFSLKTAADGFNGLEILKREEFALLILDIMMPGMDGWEVLEQIRADPRWDAMPVLMCTPKADDGHWFERGADGYLTLPFGPELFIEQVQMLLHNGRTKPTKS